MEHMDLLFQRYPALEGCREAVYAAAEAIIACYKAGGKVLLCGNGGSCADCEHIAGELMKGFLKKRPLSPEKKAAMQAACPALTDGMLEGLQGSLPAIPLTGMSALSTAWGNDVNYELGFAQQLLGLGRPGDVLIAISTGGNAKNVAAAAAVAGGLGITVIGLTGISGGRLAEMAGICIKVPESETYKIQELHLPVYHALCAEAEAAFFAE